jgi:hypothetical protein
LTRTLLPRFAGQPVSDVLPTPPCAGRISRACGTSAGAVCSSSARDANPDISRCWSGVSPRLACALAVGSPDPVANATAATTSTNSAKVDKTSRRMRASLQNLAQRPLRARNVVVGQEATPSAPGKQVDRYAYGPPQVRFTDEDIDQAHAAGVLIAFERGRPIIVDRHLYGELVKGAINRTHDELQPKAEAAAKEKKAARAGKAPADPVTVAKRARPQLRELSDQAHGANSDLGHARPQPGRRGPAGQGRGTRVLRAAGCRPRQFAVHADRGADREDRRRRHSPRRRRPGRRVRLSPRPHAPRGPVDRAWRLRRAERSRRSHQSPAHRGDHPRGAGLASETREHHGLPPLPRTTPHTLRRTYISIALPANKFDVKWVMGQVGHADSKMTMDVYAHLQQRLKCEHGEAFDAMIREEELMHGDPIDAAEEAEARETASDHDEDE